MVKSLQSGKNDASTYWREVENWNIAMTMREHPFLGMGLGREYVEHMENDDISSIYPEFKFWPHNSILGMLLFFGVFAFTMMWAIVSAIVFLAVRSYRLAASPEDRAAALWTICVVLFCTIQAYGDIGAPFMQYRIFMALAMAVAGKLATATGAWTVRGLAPAPAESPVDPLSV
jgi:O-antigen ligase